MFCYISKKEANLCSRTYINRVATLGHICGHSGPGCCVSQRGGHSGPRLPSVGIVVCHSGLVNAFSRHGFLAQQMASIANVFVGF